MARRAGFWRTLETGISNAPPHPTDAFGLLLVLAVGIAILCGLTWLGMCFYPQSLLAIPVALVALGVYNWVRVYRVGAAHIRERGE